MVVPRGAVPGVTRLAVDIGGTRRAMLKLPREAAVGDTVRLLNEGLEGWRCDIVRARQLPSVVRAMVPGDALPGTTAVQVDTMDGQMITFPVPADAHPGDTLLLTRGRAQGQWSCKIQRMKHDLSAPPAVAPGEDVARHGRLQRAILDAGGAWSRKLAREASPRLAVPGVVALQPIVSGEALGSVPSSLFLSTEAAREHSPELCRAVDALAHEMPREQARLPAQAAVLARLLAAAEAPPAAGGSPAGAAAVCGRPAVWGAFAGVLACEALATHPYRLALRDPAASHALLEPSPEAELVERLAWGVLVRYDVITQHVDPALLGPGFTAERFLRAWLLLVTRAFEVGGARTTLVPGLDCFNHRPALEGARVRWDAGTGEMRLEATRDIAQGEEVFISYGALSNPMLFRTYGFTLPPAEEPGWTYVSLPASAQHFLRARLPAAHAVKVMELDSRRLHPTVAAALEAAALQGGDTAGAGRQASAFLRELLQLRRERYVQDALFRPTLEGLEGGGGPWGGRPWDVVSPGAGAGTPTAAGVGLADALRVKASEYLCLAAHLEVLDGEARMGEAPGGAADGLRSGLLAAIAGVRGRGGGGGGEAASLDR